MASITVFVIAIAVGCLTGVIIALFTHDRRASDSTHAPLFWALHGDD